MEKGKIVQILGPVIDVEFETEQLPLIHDALTVVNKGKEVVMEVEQSLIIQSKILLGAHHHK